RIVLVSDLQEGSRLDVLADYPWPDDVQLDLRPVKSTQPTNAGLQRLAERTDAEAGKTREVRVRVLNDAASGVDQFQLAWLGADEKPVGEPIDVYVPAGESRVVHVPRSAEAEQARRLHLTGDDCEFDNSLYLATRPQTGSTVLYVGKDATNDPQQLRY